MKDEITIPRAWLERLIERADTIAEFKRNETSDSFRFCVIGLMGYIESAKQLLTARP